jgi:hypothetical protein
VRGKSANSCIFGARSPKQLFLRNQFRNAKRICLLPGLAFLAALLTLINVGCNGFVTATSNSVPPAVRISTTSLPAGQQNVAYQTTLGATGGTAPYSWSISTGSLPAGLTLTANSGAISGTPSSSGNSTFTAQVTDANSKTATKSLSLSIASASQGLAISTSSLPGGTVGGAYSVTLQASGGTAPYTWSITAGALPAGLNLAAASGVISGTPTAAGNPSFTVQVKDFANKTAQKSLSISIAAAGPQPLQITTTLLPQASTSQSYTATLQATGGTPSYTWSITAGQLPAGLSLMAASGQITGTATTVGQSSFTVQVKDSAATPATATRALTLTVVSVAALDQYGGRTDIKCAQATGWFHAEEINSRWWLCTPLGNAFFFQGIGAWSFPGNSPKYGNNANTAALATQTEFMSWGFNAVGEKTYGLLEPVGPCSGCQKLPEIQTFETNAAAMFNRYGVAPSFKPVKNVTWGNNGHGSPAWWKSLVDVFDSVNYGGYLFGCYTNSACGISNVYLQNPYFVGVLSGDSDFFLGVGAGPDFDAAGYGGSHNDSDLGRITLTTSPIQTFDESPTLGNFGGDTELYLDTKVYSKTAMASSPATCSPATPCSLRDYLFKEYGGNIGALNTAWGANYTTFDSSGINQSQNICAGTTWTGSNTTCSDTLTSLNVSPESVQVVVDGVLQAGDCPWFAYGNGGFCGTPPVNTGSIRGMASSTVANSSSVNYITGVITINFKSAPAAGSHTITVKYVQNGWMYGTGLMDEDGRNLWTGTNRVCLLPVAGGGPGTASYACRPGNPSSWPAPNADPTLAADLEGWVAQFAAQYYGVNSAQLKAACSHCLYLGIDITGSWYEPPNKNILVGAAGNVDVLFTELGWSNDESANTGVNSQAAYNTALSYLTQYYGDYPLMNFLALNANPDSALTGFPPDSVVSFKSQANRAQGYQDMVSAMLNAPSFNKTYPWVGLVWWGSHDFNDFEKTDFGLKTPSDNAYDGHEAVIASVACSPPLQSYTCGGEAGNYGDLITGVGAANQLWLIVP